MEESKGMKVKEIKCTMCGKTFDEWDINLCDNRYDIFVNYPSVHDMERIQFNFCVDCFDRVLDILIPMCKINPIVEDDWWSHVTNDIIKNGMQGKNKNFG